VLGNILQPDESWLLNSRLPTVILRMNRQSKNAQRIAEALARHPKVKKVFYPSLFVDPDQQRVRDEQCVPGRPHGPEIDGARRPRSTPPPVEDRAQRRQPWWHGIAGLSPATTTHSEMPPELLEAYGVTDGLVRLSIGVEDWRDLLRDFQQALDAC
jgi:cystathionine beta-lyase/cystathionine gamma-synthase